jgi:hypothetical protein
MKYHKEPQNWEDFYGKRQKLRKMGMRFGKGIHTGFWWES